MKNLAIIFMSISSFFACKKDHDHVTENKIVLNWAQPLDGSTVKLGDTLRIEGNATFPTELHGYEVVVTRASDSLTPLFSEDADIHATDLQISKKWKNSLSDSTRLLVKIEIAKDHSGSNNEVFRRIVWAVK